MGFGVPTLPPGDELRFCAGPFCNARDRIFRDGLCVVCGTNGTALAGGDDD